MRFDIANSNEPIIRPLLEVNIYGDLLLKLNNITILKITNKGTLKIRRFYSEYDKKDLKNLDNMGISILDHTDGLYIEKYDPSTERLIK